jgi:hypothetical protein
VVGARRPWRIGAFATQTPSMANQYGVSPDEFERMRRVATQALRHIQSPEFQRAAQLAREAQQAQARSAIKVASAAAARRAMKIDAAQIMFAQNVSREIERLRPSFDLVMKALTASATKPATRVAMYNIAQAAAEQRSVDQTLDDSVDQLEQILDSKEVDQEALTAFEQGVADDLDLSAWVEAQTDWLLERVPRLSRDRARKMVVMLAWLLCAVTLTGISFVPILGAVPGAVGIDAPTVARKAGKGFDRIFPPEEEPKDDAE